MRKGLVLITLTLIMAWVVAPAEAEPEIVPIFASLVRDGAPLGKEVGDTCYVEGDTVYGYEGTAILVTGVKTCDSYSGTRTSYEIAYRGLPFHVQSNEVEVEEKEIERIQRMSPEELAGNKKKSLAITRQVWLESVGIAFEELAKKKQHGIAILRSDIFGTIKYSGGRGFRVMVYNPTQKTIKYVTIQYVGYNAVKDPVKDSRSKSYTLTLKGIGPIEPGQSAGYTEEYAWTTDIVQSHKITGIKIEYTDGTKKTVKSPQKAELPYHLTKTIEDYINWSERKLDAPDQLGQP